MPHESSRSKIQQYDPIYTPNPGGAKWQRVSVSFKLPDNREVFGIGKDDEEAAANAVANMRRLPP